MAVDPPKALVLFDIDGTLLRRAGPHHREASGHRRQENHRHRHHHRRRPGRWHARSRHPDCHATPRGCFRGTHTPAYACNRRVRATLLPAHMSRFAPQGLPGCADAALQTMAARHSQPASSPETSRASAGPRWSAPGSAATCASEPLPKWRTIASDLVRIALRHARREGWIDRTSPVALIGDHPNDIRAAKANRVRSVAVATGLIGTAELAQHAPDILVPDMRKLSIDMLLYTE